MQHWGDAACFQITLNNLVYIFICVIDRISVALRIGLTMTLNINQNEYVSETGDVAGAVVVIRPQNQMPFPGIIMGYPKFKMCHVT